MARQVNLVRSKVRQRMLTRLAESSGRPLECHGNVSPREMAVEGAKNPGTEPGVQVGPFALDATEAPLNQRGFRRIEPGLSRRRATPRR